jgi:hypothetical protein
VAPKKMPIRLLLIKVRRGKPLIFFCKKKSHNGTFGTKSTLVRFVSTFFLQLPPSYFSSSLSFSFSSSYFFIPLPPRSLAQEKTLVRFMFVLKEAQWGKPSTFSYMKKSQNGILDAKSTLARFFPPKKIYISSSSSSSFSFFFIFFLLFLHSSSSS